MKQRGAVLGQAIFIGLMALCLAAIGYGGWVAWKKTEARKLAADEARKLAALPLPACEDPRPRLPNAAPVDGLDAHVLRFSSNCEWIVVGNNTGSVMVLERKSGRLLQSAQALPSRIEGMLLTADDKYLFLTAVDSDEIAVLSAPRLEVVTRFSLGQRAMMTKLAYDGANRTLITGSSGGIQGWKMDFTPGSAPRRLFGAKASGGVISIALSADGKFIAAGTASGALNLWSYDGAAGRVKEVAESIAHAKGDWITGVAFTADSRNLVSLMRRKKEMHVWQVPSLKRVATAAAEPAWELVLEPSKMLVQPPRDYAGADRKQHVYELHGAGAEGIYEAWRGKPPFSPAAFRGKISAWSDYHGVFFYDIARADPVLLVPARRR